MKNIIDILKCSPYWIHIALLSKYHDSLLQTADLSIRIIEAHYVNLVLQTGLFLIS